MMTVVLYVVSLCDDLLVYVASAAVSLWLKKHEQDETRLFCFATAGWSLCLVEEVGFKDPGDVNWGDVLDGGRAVDAGFAEVQDGAEGRCCPR